MADQRSLPESVSAAASSVPTDAQVAAFLTQHPDFLTVHEELIPLLTPPSHRRGDNIVDMQRFLTQRLQDEVARLRGQHKALISTSRANLSSQQRVHGAALAIIGALSFEQLLQIVTTDLAVLLDVDVTTICIESGRASKPPMAGILLLPTGAIDELLGAEREAMLEDHVRGDPAIFGSGAGLVKSEALLRLVVPKGPPGLLALGSRKPTKFKPGHGTELLCFLARTLALTIAQWLDL